MRILIEQSSFMDVEFIQHETNRGDNGDRFTIKLRAEGQPVEFNGKEIGELAFDIVGGLELEEFLEAMAAIKKIMSAQAGKDV